MGYLQDPDQLTFEQLRRINIQRCKRWHPQFGTGNDEWTGADWSNAAAGEMGEAANVVKKLRREEFGMRQAGQGDYTDAEFKEILLQKLQKEIGDTVIYLDLLAAYYGLALEDCAVEAFNQISEREGFPEKL